MIVQHKVSVSDCMSFSVCECVQEHDNFCGTKFIFSFMSICPIIFLHSPNALHIVLGVSRTRAPSLCNFDANSVFI